MRVKIKTRHATRCFSSKKRIVLPDPLLSQVGPPALERHSMKRQIALSKPTFWESGHEEK
jgi:hypothetical protein